MTDTPAIPIVDAPIIDAIPAELKDIEQWVFWGWELRDGRFTKVPYGAGSQRPPPTPPKKALARKPKTWLPFIAAHGWYKKHNAAGVGFEFADDGPHFGVDLDDCRNPETGEIEPKALEIIWRFATYAEISPSKTGVKLIGRGRLNLPDPDKSGKFRTGRRGQMKWSTDNTGAIECYDRGRFFCITGQRFGEWAIADCQAALDELFPQWFPQDDEPCAPTTTVIPNGEAGDDAKIIRLAKGFKDGHRFESLFNGQWEGLGYLSQSEADLALCGKLAFMTGPNASHVDALFRQSGLFRDKWEQREDYRNSTIAKALKGRTEFFDWNRRSKKRRANSQKDGGAPQITEDDEIANAEPDFSDDDADGESSDSPKMIPICMEMIVTVIKFRTQNWPRRYGSTLFYHIPGRPVQYLESTASLFSWLGMTAPPPAKFYRITGSHSKEEVYAAFQREAQEYRAIETLPHEPLIRGHYYACPTMEPGDGKAIQQLLNRYCPETPIDRDLLLALFATMFWGGPGGARPAFVFTGSGRGIGKSKTSASAGHLAGGTVELLADEDAGKMKGRLLSKDGRRKRVAMLDNVKTPKFSWADLEGIITSPVISGHEMYKGEGERPNLLTWLITLNGCNLSRDLAQRSVIIRLKRPTYSGDWEQDTFDFIEEFQAEIIADLIAFLRSDRTPLAKFSRWGLWERHILERLPDPAEAQRVILERQADADADDEECALIEDFFRNQLISLTFAPDVERIFIPSPIASRWLGWFSKRPQSVTASSRYLRQQIEESTIKQLSLNGTKAWGRGFIWCGEKWEAGGPHNQTLTDIEVRIEHLGKRDKIDKAKS